jgi:hypothetical protein
VGRELDQGEQMEVAYVDRNEMEELLAAGGDVFAHAVAYPCWMRFAAMGLLDAWMPTA